MACTTRRFGSTSRCSPNAASSKMSDDAKFILGFGFGFGFG
jgi:hypothetical protein